MKPLIWLFVLAVASFAQGPAANLIERLNRMTPSQRQRVLERMPPERRQLLEKRINNFNSIAPEARERLKRDYEFFQQLPPEKQDEARRTLKSIADLPEDRRKQVRGAIHNLRQQPAAVQERRLASRGFQDRFSEEERKLIRDAVALLPAPPTEQE